MSIIMHQRDVVPGLLLVSGFVMLIWLAPLGSNCQTPPAGTSDGIQQAADYMSSPAAAQGRGRGGGPGGSMTGVYKSRITPNWFQNNTRFWYRNDLRGGDREFILVDAEHGTRNFAFDHAKFAAALSKASGMTYPSNRLPFDAIQFVNDGKTVQFQVGSAIWNCDLTSYECSQASSSAAAVVPAPPDVSIGQSSLPIPTDLAREAESPFADIPAAQPAGGAGLRGASSGTAGGARGAGGRGALGGRGGFGSPASPDGNWTATVRNNNVYITSRSDQKEIQLSQDGQPGLSYGHLQWAPDSKSLVAWRIEPGDNKEVYTIETSPRGGGRAILHTSPYALPGDKFAAYELNLFDVSNQKQIKPDVDRIDYRSPSPRWNRDGFHFTYEKYDRGHQRFRVIEVDTHSGALRNIIDERTDTFIWNDHVEGMNNMPLITYLDATDEILRVSERDGWRHIYLIDAKAGTVKNQVTKGPWVVRGIDNIDRQSRQIWFRASGVYPGQDPYLIHYGRVNFDGSGLVFMTASHGNHAIAYSPDNQYIIDTFNRVDMAPAHELRRVADGKLVCELEKADDSELRAGGWQPPEMFVAKGRDGTTDIYGIICRPRNLDPSKKYPVLEEVYAGPHDSFVPHGYSTDRRFSSYTDLGFIVVKIDGMGTANRSKAFHDVCWKNLADAGFPDRIPWHQAAAKKYPYYDLSRVGIYGNSAGGQSAAAALIFHGDFYKAAAANSGCHDNRMDKASWNEQWMGYPVGPQYAACSNIVNASRLQGRLMLIVGELDTNVPPESTFRFVDALIRAQKDFDLLVVPGAGHGANPSGAPGYLARRQQDFFLRHLQGIENRP
jgi:dipeptidyl aminopeptidase/acylaminoacyl peptidase